MDPAPCPPCPNCGATDVRESYTHDLRDMAMELFGLVAYRCRACRIRFHRRPPAETTDEDREEQVGESESEGDEKR